MSDAGILQEFVDYLRAHVPMTGHMQLAAGEVLPEGVTLCASLGANLNDKQTAFAGTLATLSTLSGWTMTSLICKEAELYPDIAVIYSTIDYLRPCSDNPITARCFRPEPDEALRFLAQLQQDCRADLELRAEVRSQNKQSVAFVGRYCARLLS